MHQIGLCGEMFYSTDLPPRTVAIQSSAMFASELTGPRA